ncbi:MAG: S-layer homology domain-containing protein [Oscillospiraceae bacterium]|jgi:hypothetical protein|nr:S-layer homology domain-containing protein [Oscillospiraceae bacterium]
MLAKKYTAALLLALAIAQAAVLPESAVYATDDARQTSWYDDAVKKLEALGIVSPDDDMEVSVTRADVVRAVNAALGYSGGGEPIDPDKAELEPAPEAFADIPPEHELFAQFMFARAIGIVRGDENNLALPDKPISRCEAAMMFTRMLELEVSPGGAGEAGGIYADEADIPEWGYDGVMAMTARGYMKGVGDAKFFPGNAMTRAEFAVLLDRILGEVITEDREIEGEAFNGNVTVVGGNVRFTDVIIKGTLIAVGAAGEVTFENVVIYGDFIQKQII